VNGVAGPRNLGAMAGMDVKDRVSYVPEEGHDLAGSDLAAYAHGGVTIDCRRVVMQHAACKGIALNIRLGLLV